MKTATFLLSALVVVGYAASAAAADVNAGKKVFYKCAICHTAVKGRNSIGPSLFDVVGRKAASLPGYNFSDALKASNKIWDEKTLDAWLTNPQKDVPGTKMTFPGLPNAEDRANVIAYLATLK
ncbi:cytochrome c family protein [Rhodoblastus acidophilus]|uniref:Cytochrome c family protein n=1 Tax=Candidatus Rhodoblastus alkanivorans TaxID=2954117 RepID=A0ABS9Z557_9HYPH|nr:cytochrome c family protein [Candidatus Rhodoblastus alkanivorans]MCI4677413.1 cytochrome c family protein [Candidatus Rhodoblastus alkanivorans]MCI4681772.1 cytochrome c family protein [Candidatus Rhodoblastus alkanivorans]MDI4642821.1 cytochrome c family protein [Rhodoblastus acidophilus]